MYLNSHFVITTGFLAWLYLFRNDHFYFVRNMFMVAMGLALVGYALFPTAPPRLFPARASPTRSRPSPASPRTRRPSSLLVNKYAAVPSMHIAFSLMIAVPAATLVRNAGRRGLLVALPAARLLRDRRHRQPLLVRRASPAPLVACLAAVAARQLARLRPDAWSWRERARAKRPPDRCRAGYRRRPSRGRPAPQPTDRRARSCAATRATG